METYINFILDSLSDVHFIAPTTSVIIAILLTMILMAASAFASGSEIAFFSLSPTEMAEVNAGKTASDRSIRKLHDDSERTLATILITNNFVNVTIIMLCNNIFGHIIHFGEKAYWLQFLSLTVLLTFLLLL